MAYTFPNLLQELPVTFITSSTAVTASGLGYLRSSSNHQGPLSVQFTLGAFGLPTLVTACKIYSSIVIATWLDICTMYQGFLKFDIDNTCDERRVCCYFSPRNHKRYAVKVRYGMSFVSSEYIFLSLFRTYFRQNRAVLAVIYRQSTAQ